MLRQFVPTLLSVLLLAPSVTPSVTPSVASACVPLLDVWEYDSVFPMPVDETGQGVLVFEGSLAQPFARIFDGVEIEVMRGGEPVEGALEPGPVPGWIAWRSNDPVEVGVDYVLRSRLGLEIDPEGWDEHPLTLQWQAPRIEGDGVEVISIRAVPSSRFIEGGCVTDSESCGDCEREGLGEEATWRVIVKLSSAAGTRAPLIHRVAVGADGDEAEAIVARTPFQRLRVVSGQYLISFDAGDVANWTQEEGCAAVEIARPDGTPISLTTECMAVPGFEATPPVLPGPAQGDGDADHAGGCSAAPSAHGVDPLALLFLIGSLLVLFRRRFRVRRALGAVLTAAIALSGCDATEPAEPPCVPGQCDVADPPLVERGRLLPALFQRAEKPPAISGGTLAVHPSGAVAVVADPARGQIFVVDLATQTTRGRIDLDGEPGRAVIDSAGAFAYVTDRTGTTVARIDVATGELASTIDTCQSPRGLALTDDSTLYVACQTGALQRIDAATGAQVRSTWIADDLRDVLVSQGRVFVTRFRAAELIEVNAAGEIVSRRTPPDLGGRDEAKPTQPNTAWRTIARDDGTILMLHQRAQLSVVRVNTPNGYGMSDATLCGESIVQPTLTAFDVEGEGRHVGVMPGAVLSVDVAERPGTTELAVAAPGNIDLIARGRANNVVQFDLERPVEEDPFERTPAVCLVDGDRPAVVNREITAIAFDDLGGLYAYDRQSSELVAAGGVVLLQLSTEEVFDTGHDLFHKDAGRGIACASCHPEGRDDGHTWLFADLGLRRSQSLRGGLKGTEPFHWQGDMPDFATLTREVMGERMGGPSLTTEYSDTIIDWLDALPTPAAAVSNPEAAERGGALFSDPVVGCAGCHSGSALTDNRSYDVGTGGILQVPSLRGVASRAPFMHDGCASVLEERFTECGGGDAHGQTSHLQGGQLADLVEYMKTL